MRILAIDVGTGTQDVLLWESGVAVENLVQMVMPSPTVLVERRVRAATRQRLPLLLTGVTMGGGPCTWAIMDHVRAGLPVYATPDAARTLDDDLGRVCADGIAVVADAFEAPRVRAARYPLLVNVGNFHTIAFQMVPVETANPASGRARQPGAPEVSVPNPAYERSDAHSGHNGARAVTVSGLFEHHTGELKPGQLDTLLDRLADGTLTNREVFDSQGHGALLRNRTPATPELCAVTGPRRALMASSRWRPYYAVPHGDMMLAGAFGLLRAAATRVPQWREEIEASLG